jgi:hypothetical protein
LCGLLALFWLQPAPNDAVRSVSTEGRTPHINLCLSIEGSGPDLSSRKARLHCPGPEDLPLQEATLFHRIMTIKFDDVAYDPINRWATGNGRATINERRISPPASTTIGLRRYIAGRARTYTKDVFPCDKNLRLG